MKFNGMLLSSFDLKKKRKKEDPNHLRYAYYLEVPNRSCHFSMPKVLRDYNGEV